MAGLFDIFTNKNAQDAADAQKAGLQAGYGLASGDITQGMDALRQQYGLAGSAITQGANTATGALTQAQQTGQGALNQGYNTASGALGQGYGAASGALNQGYGAAAVPLMQQYQTGQAGQTAYGNALGLGGDAGNASATAAFWNNPGIKAQLDVGNENVLRNASRTGSLASGGTNVDLQKFGQQTAAQGWGNYVNQLSPYLSMGQNAAGALANNYTGLGQGQAALATGQGQGQANLATGLGSNLTNLATGTGGALANVATGQGAQQAALDTGLGQGLYGAYGKLADLGYGTQTGMGNAQANADLANNQASANMWGLIGNLGGSALKFAGGAGGGSGASAAMAQTGPTYANATMGAMGGVPFPIF